jgi:TonB family protein
MASGAEPRGWNGPSRRRVARFFVQAPLDVTVVRSGTPDTVPGRSFNVGEGGIAVMMAGELAAGETVEVEVRLAGVNDPLRARAVVRYQDKLRCGLEFVGFTAEQSAVIRDWAKETNAETEITAPTLVMEKKSADASGKGTRTAGSGAPGKPARKPRWVGWIVFLIFVTIVVAVFWWRWNRQWEELESGLKISETAAAERPQAQVPGEVMEKLLIHRVEPAYPPEARRANLQGIVALDVIIGRDGSVMTMRALNGPDVLARAAMDALRWWKFSPYRVNGEPAVVETTMAVEFKR